MSPKGCRCNSQCPSNAERKPGSLAFTVSFSLDGGVRTASGKRELSVFAASKTGLWDL